MLQTLRAHQLGRPLLRIVWWYFLRFFCWLWVRGCYRLQCHDVDNVPRSGGVLFVCNHQSYLDPIIVGVACGYRQCYAMARATLFGNRLFGWFLRSINSIPINQEAPGKKAIRRSIEVLGAGHAFLIFPEGARTLDGKTQAFAPGTMVLIRRARPTVVPVAVEGAFDAWPRNHKLPRWRGRIAVTFAKPIAADTLMDMGTERALKHLRDQVEAMRVEMAGTMAAK